jgi:hypothetical protein
MNVRKKGILGRMTEKWSRAVHLATFLSKLTREINGVAFFGTH